MCYSTTVGRQNLGGNLSTGRDPVDFASLESRQERTVKMRLVHRSATTMLSASFATMSVLQEDEK